MRPLQTAILGCGGFAQRHATNLMRLHEQYELVAFADVDPLRARAFADRFTAGRAAVFDHHAALFAGCSLDVVFICLPPFGHSDEVEQAAARGIHIFIEKPIALSAAHAWRMVAAVEAAGVKTQVGFMYRFGAGISKLKHMVMAGEAGSVGLMSARYFCNALHADWWRRRDLSGGQLVEQVIHMVDLMRYLMGEPATVYSIQRNLFHQDVTDYTVEDVSGTVIGFRNGGIGVIYASNNAIPGRWINDYKVVTARLTAEFADANHAVFTHTGSEPRIEEIAADLDYYEFEVLDLHNAIRQQRPTLTPMREGALSLELALAARESAETGNVLALPG